MKKEYKLTQVQAIQLDSLFELLEEEIVEKTNRFPLELERRFIICREIMKELLRKDNG